ncbi:MAG: hypothetical protein QOD77_2175 [Thermoplasmata archaeon]|jgi:hypothetical protein|nr:hypothetical protein [Thermoplasmata archaeon]
MDANGRADSPCGQRTRTDADTRGSPCPCGRGHADGHGGQSADTGGDPLLRTSPRTAVRTDTDTAPREAQGKGRKANPRRMTARLGRSGGASLSGRKPLRTRRPTAGTPTAKTTDHRPRDPGRRAWLADGSEPARQPATGQPPALPASQPPASRPLEAAGPASQPRQPAKQPVSHRTPHPLRQPGHASGIQPADPRARPQARAAEARQRDLRPWPRRRVPSWWGQARGRGHGDGDRARDRDSQRDGDGDRDTRSNGDEDSQGDRDGDRDGGTTTPFGDKAGDSHRDKPTARDKHRPAAAEARRRARPTHVPGSRRPDRPPHAATTAPARLRGSCDLGARQEPPARPLPRPTGATRRHGGIAATVRGSCGPLRDAERPRV